LTCFLLFFDKSLCACFFYSPGKRNGSTPAEVNAQLGKVTLGQILGFTAIIAISLIGLVLGLVVPDGYIDLIGFVPILIGGKSQGAHYSEGLYMIACSRKLLRLLLVLPLLLHPFL
jgi:hypothetical protein